MTCTGLFLTYSLVRPKHGPGDNAHVDTEVCGHRLRSVLSSPGTGGHQPVGLGAQVRARGYIGSPSGEGGCLLMCRVPGVQQGARPRAEVRKTARGLMRT